MATRCAPSTRPAANLAVTKLLCREKLNYKLCEREKKLCILDIEITVMFVRKKQICSVCQAISFSKSSF